MSVTKLVMLSLLLIPLAGLINPQDVNAETVSVEHDGNTMDVTATLSNGTVESAEVDPDFFSVILFVTTSDDDGELTITLPRELIDSTFDGEDDEFIVLVDGDEYDYEETEVTSTERTLVIEILGGSEEIEIIGTDVIPEFGILAALVLAAAVGAIVVLSRKDQIPNLMHR